jgi:nucleotide-binding universal stress UspA family protein
MTAPLPLLALTDFSNSAEQAVKRAALLASSRHQRLDLLHVFCNRALELLQELLGVGSERETLLIENSRRQLQQMADELQRDYGIKVTPEFRMGNVLDEVLAIADGGQMMVLGAHGHSPLCDALIGSMALRVLSKCRQPILVVKKPPEEAYRRVIVPVDFSLHSAAALQMALTLAPEARIMLVHAFEVPFEGKLKLAGATEQELSRYRSEAQQKALLGVNQMLSDIPQKDVSRIAHLVEKADPAVFTLQQAEDLGADLIVMGKHGRSMVEEMLLGSVTRHVLADAKCDVLVCTSLS